MKYIQALAATLATSAACLLMGCMGAADSSDATSEPSVGEAESAMITQFIGCVTSDEEGADKCHELAHQIANTHSHYRNVSPFCPPGQLGCFAEI